jgi:hypothetical protein
MQAIQQNYRDQIKTQIYHTNAYNILKEIDIYHSCMYYGSLAVICRLMMIAIASNKVHGISFIK